MKKIFSIVGVGATIWVAYVLLKNKDLKSGLDDVKNRLSGFVKGSNGKPEMQTKVVVSSDKPQMIDDSGMVPKPAMTVINNLDWGTKKISSSEDMFTEQGRLDNSAWGNKETIII